MSDIFCKFKLFCLLAEKHNRQDLRFALRFKDKNAFADVVCSIDGNEAKRLKHERKSKVRFEKECFLQGNMHVAVN